MKLKFIVAALAASLSLASVQAVEINFTSPAFEIAKTSGGVPLDTGFTFSLGSFGGFTPSEANVADWVANFTAVPVNASIAWDTDFTQFSQTASLTSNAGAFATTIQAFVWGFNTQSLAAGSGAEWVLFTNPSWLFPLSSTILPVSWDLSDAGTVAVVGQLAAMGSDPFFVTASVGAPIPEPSTYVAIIGALALGFVAYRRRQLAA